MKKHLSVLIFIWFLLWACLAFADSHHVKPTIWACDPGTVAYNCARLGLPMSTLAIPMWEGAGDKVCDYSGNQFHGTFQSNTSWLGSSVDFNDGGINCGNSSILDAPDSFTLMIRVKWDVYANAYIVGKSRTTPNPTYNYQIQIYNNEIYASVGMGGLDKDYTYSWTPTLGKWYWLTLSYDNSHLCLYIDNIRVINQVLSGTLNTGPTFHFICGYKYGEPYGDFDGQIDEILFFNDFAIQPSQINNILTNPFGMFAPIKLSIWDIAAPGGNCPQIITVQQ